MQATQSHDGVGKIQRNTIITVVLPRHAIEELMIHNSMTEICQPGARLATTNTRCSTMFMHIYWILAPTWTRHQLDPGLRLICLEHMTVWLYMWYALPDTLGDQIGTCGTWCADGTKGCYRRHKASGDGVENEYVGSWIQNRNTSVALPTNVIQITLIRFYLNRSDMQARDSQRHEMQINSTGKTLDTGLSKLSS